jgi:hypothetical protein
MPDYSGTLKKFRDSGYPKDKSDSDKETSVRVIKLTDDEAKELESYSQGAGSEQVCEVSGKLEGNTFRVMSVSGSGDPDMNVGPQEAMAGGAPPMMR